MAPEDDDLDDELEDDEDYDDDERAAPQTEVTTGHRARLHHATSAPPSAVGQRLVLDLRLEVGECDATVNGAVETRLTTRQQRVALVANGAPTRPSSACRPSPTACWPTSPPRVGSRTKPRAPIRCQSRLVEGVAAVVGKE
jgi:hypothetical protein